MAGNGMKQVRTQEVENLVSPACGESAGESAADPVELQNLVSPASPSRESLLSPGRSRESRRRSISITSIEPEDAEMPLKTRRSLADIRKHTFHGHLRLAVLQSGTTRMNDLLMYQDILPWWGYDQEVGKLAETLAEEDKPVSMQSCTGPAILPAKVALFFFWPLYIAVTGFGVFSAECTHHHNHWRMRGLYAAAICLRLIVEFKCLRYATIPYLQTLGRFQWMNVTIPFQCWLLIVGCMSITNMLDLMSDSLFVVSATENMACSTSGQEDHRSVQIDLLFVALMKKTNLHFLTHLSYANFAQIIWLLTLSQMIYPLLECTPRWSQTIDYSVGSRQTKFKNLFGYDSNLGDCLYQLADATVMASLAVQVPEYPRARESLRRRIKSETGEFDPLNSFQFLRGALSEGMVSVGLVGTLENSPQILLQSMVFACAMVESHLAGRSNLTPFEKQTVISLTLSTIVTMTKLWKTRVLVVFFLDVNSAISESGLPLSAEASQELTTIRRMVAVLILWAVLLTFCVYLAVGQLIATTLTCKGQVWLPLHGCFDLSV